MEKNKKTETRIINGYVAIYKPNHPNSIKSEGNRGFVYEHVIVCSLMLGRPLKTDELEQVHHLNFNRQDNRPKNLIVLSKGMHTKLHNWIDRSNLQQFIMEHSTEGHLVYRCLNCGEYYLEDKKYCNAECRKEFRIKHIPIGKEELKAMLETMGKMEIAKKFNTDLNGINSWIRDYNL